MNTVITDKDLKMLDRRHRATLLNSLAGFRTAIIVGTLSGNNVPNAAIFNSLIHFGADPALWGLVMRPDPLNRDTFRNILLRKRYTLNYLPLEYAQNAHKTSAKYATEESEFHACGLTPQLNMDDGAPFVAEAKIKILMELVETIPVSLNETTIVIGRPIQIDYPTTMVSTDGFVNLAEGNILGCIGLDAYCTTNTVVRFEYAKPGVEVVEKDLGHGAGD
jgi:flavin reductase (DIM6/NTAB) family NADH-FMN oxidoreductase RutF